MPVTVEEKFDSRETTSGKSVELTYVIRGTDDDVEAMSALKATAPLTYGDLIRGHCRIEYLGPQMWSGTAPYEPPGTANKEPLEVGESSYQFDTGGGTQHITQSLATIHRYPSGSQPPDFKGAIGVTADGVEGVDITVPVYSFSETHCKASGFVTNTYKGKLFNLTGKTNNAPFKGFAAGEVLFLGASGAKRGDGDWEITYHFAASPNKTGITIGDITNIEKKGWEYLWVLYWDEEDTDAKVLVKRPKFVYVEKVYEEGDFADLGIGTT